MCTTRVICVKCAIGGIVLCEHCKKQQLQLQQRMTTFQVFKVTSNSNNLQKASALNEGQLHIKNGTQYVVSLSAEVQQQQKVN